LGTPLVLTSGRYIEKKDLGKNNSTRANFGYTPPEECYKDCGSYKIPYINKGFEANKRCNYHIVYDVS
jgi:hypothetical protein